MPQRQECLQRLLEIGQCRRIVLLLGGELTQIGTGSGGAPRIAPCPESPRRLFVASTSFRVIAAGASNIAEMIERPRDAPMIAQVAKLSQRFLEQTACRDLVALRADNVGEVAEDGGGGGSVAGFSGGGKAALMPRLRGGPVALYRSTTASAFSSAITPLASPSWR